MGQTATYQPFANLMHKDGLGLVFVRQNGGRTNSPNLIILHLVHSVMGQMTGIKKPQRLPAISL